MIENMEEYSFEDYPLGVNEIAEVLGVKPATVTQWQRRMLLPKPNASINKGRTKLWKNKTIIDWANSTGRNNNRKTYVDSGHYLRKKTNHWNIDYATDSWYARNNWDIDVDDDRLDLMKEEE